MTIRSSVRSFAFGVLVGVLAGSVAVASAAFGYKGWQRFSDDFKTGYLTGFMDMANIARNLQPGGYIDTKYPLVPKAKPLAYRAEIDRQYENPENQGYTITSMIQLAAFELQKTYGKPVPPHTRVRGKLEYQLGVLQRNKEAETADPKKAEPRPETEVDAVAKKVLAPEKKVPPPAEKQVKKEEPEPRKWCRCDGKDPKAERARKREERAAAKASDKG